MVQTWTRLGETAQSNASTLILEEAVDWSEGSEIVIATTGHRHSQTENEVRVIESVQNGGYVLELDDPLAYKLVPVYSVILQVISLFIVLKNLHLFVFLCLL